MTNIRRRRPHEQANVFRMHKPRRVGLGLFLLISIGTVFGFCFGITALYIGSKISQKVLPANQHDVSSTDAPIQKTVVDISVTLPDFDIANQPQGHEIRASTKLFSTLPSDKQRTFYSASDHISMGMVRALRQLGWTNVQKKEDARLIYTYSRHTSWYTQLQPWQRYNHVPETFWWNHKDTFAQGFHNYSKTSSRPQFFLPETFDMRTQQDEFHDRLYKHSGLNYPWVLKEPNVNQGKGITMLGPNSDDLKNVFDTVKHKDYIIQQYICNEMTWEDRKFDVRMFWFVASMDPLIVFYMDGYVRIGNANYDENNFNNTRNHLTTHTFLGAEGKASWSQFEDRILQIYNASPELQKRIADPIVHVRHQFKESIAQLVDAFKSNTFQRKHMTAEDSFEFYGADFIMDNDLDVWMIEAQDDTGMDDDHYFRLDMHHQIFSGMVTILQEIWDKQAKGLPILPMHNTGQWQVVYADGWMYEYDGYERKLENKATCSVSS